MFSLEFYQAYWWAIISLLGALLVFLLFVQGGQSMLLSTRDAMQRTMMVNSLGRKWELTFTTLVVFGGAFFASFPLFYSTSFGGAYWLWMSILVSFVIQAVSYNYRRKSGNVYGTRFYDTLLLINGCVGCVLLGVAVGTMFFGAEFTIEKSSIANTAMPVISRWADTHGLEAISGNNLLLGVVVLFLARTQASLYFLNNIDDDAFARKSRRRVLVDGIVFALTFVAFMAMLFTSDGYEVGDGGVIKVVQYKYFYNYMEMWWAAVALLVGAVAVLYAIGRSAFSQHWRCGIWYSGIGTVLVVMSLLWVAGYNETAYLPSITNPESSLTLANSSSSLFTLEVMSIVSLFVPVVVAYISYVWRKMDAKSITSSEMNSGEHTY